MFTGIIEATAQVLRNDGGALSIERPAAFDDLNVGSSVCVSGVCLTITELVDRSMMFAVVPETLARTKLGGLRAGDRVNLERALPVSGRFDGHVVQGHVEGTTAVSSLTRVAAGSELTVLLPEALATAVVEKGSIALDGVSLTVAHLDGNRCTVALIPETIKRTTLGALQPGDRVHVETDILARYARPTPSPKP